MMRHTLPLRHIPLLLALLAFLSASRGLAQRENNVWYFGDSAGVDFNGPVPAPLVDGAINAVEGCATIADRNSGALLFYTDGITVWNRRHRVMTNGDNLKGGLSSVQAAVIVPMPGDSAAYLIFSSQHEGSLANPDRGVVYSVVDMNADGGLGAVVRKNVPLLAPTTEKMVGVRHCNRRDYWVITHTPGDDAYHAFLVDPAGVSPTAVISHVGSVHSYHAGWLAASPDGRKLASLVVYNGGIELLDFDNCSGRVANPRVVLDRNPGYGVCFSPDNSKLYAVRDHASPELFQIDLAAGDTITRLMTATLTPPTTGYPAALQLAPDGRIYIARVRTGWLSVIDDPNAAGIACGYRDSGVYLGGQRSLWGLPNVIHSGYAPPRALLAPYDTLLCSGGCIRFEPQQEPAAGLPASWRWSFPGGTPASHDGGGAVDVCYPAPGRYPVTLTVANRWGRDTITRSIIVVDRAPAGDIVPGTIGAPLGDTVTVPILLRRDELSPSAMARPYLIRLRFNRSALLPLDGGLLADGGDRIVTLQGEIDPGRDTIASIRMLVMLGDTARAVITVDSAAWLGPCAGALRGGSGEVGIIDLCIGGDVRLVAPGGGALRVGVVGGEVVVDCALDETGVARIALVDLAGREVAAAHAVEPGRYRVAFDRAALPPGRYLCIVRTQTRVLSAPLLIGW